MNAWKSMGYGLIAALWALALACGSGGGDTASPSVKKEASLSVSVAASKVHVGGAAVAVLANLKNSSETVSWSLSGPGALTASSGAGTEFVPPATLAATQATKITAKAAGLSASASIQVLVDSPTNPTTCDVNGVVKDEDGNPVYNETAWISGFDATASDAAGKFTIAGVTVPYDLVVVAEETKTAYVYKDLTTCSPIIFLWQTPDERTVVPAQTGVLAGQLQGTLVNAGATFVSFASPEINNWYDPDSLTFSTTPVAPGVANYRVNAEWNGPGITSGTLFALTYQRDLVSGLPIQYWMASAGASIIAGLPVSPGPNLFLQPVAPDTVQGTITMPPTYALISKFVGLQFPKGNNFGIFLQTNPTSADFIYEVPDFAGATTQVCAQANDTMQGFGLPGGVSVTCNGMIPNQDGVSTIVVRHAPEPFAPVNDAEGINLDTKFAWQALEGGIHVVFFTPEQPGVDDTHPNIVIVTADTATKLPDLRAVLGDGFFPDTDYFWQIYGIGPFASIDDFVTYPVAVPPFVVPTAPVAEAFWARSLFRKFSTCDAAGVTPCP